MPAPTETKEQKQQQTEEQNFARMVEEETQREREMLINEELGIPQEEPPQDEQKPEDQQEEQSEESSSPQDVKDEGKPKADPSVDEKGVSYYNRFREQEKKNQEILEKMAQQVMQPPPQQQQQPPQQQPQQLDRNAIVQRFRQHYPDLDEVTLSAMVNMQLDLGSALIQNQLQPYQPAAAELYATNARRVLQSEEKEAFEKWGAEIDEVMGQIPVQARMNAPGARQALKNAVEIVKGRHYAETRQTMETEIQRRVDEAVKAALSKRKIVSSNNDAGTDAQTPSTQTQTQLTEEQESERKEMGFSAVNYMKTLRERQIRAKAAGRPIPKTLSL